MHENPELLNSRAIELAAHGEYSEAIACFKRAIAIEKSNYLLWYNLGITYRDAGQLSLAQEALEKAYAIEDNDDEVLEMLALVCFDSNQFDEALQYCAEGLDLNPANAHLWNTMGVVYFNRSEYTLACEAFEHAVTINPYYYDALYNLRDTYDELGNKAGVAMCQRQMQQLSASPHTIGGGDA